MTCSRTKYNQRDAERRDGVDAGTYDYVSDKADEVRRTSTRR